MSKQILDKLKEAVETYDSAMAAEAANEAVSAGMGVMDCIENGLAEGMRTISELFDEGEVFIPQLVNASKAFDAATAVLTKTMSVEEKKQSSRGKVLIHTVHGDIHSIGKNICVTMLNASGFDVIDAGCDFPVTSVVAMAEEQEVDIIAGSALMTTTMPAMRDIVNLLKEKGIRDKYICIFGGAPVSEKFVQDIGADGYSETATGCVSLALELIKNKKGV